MARKKNKKLSNKSYKQKLKTLKQLRFVGKGGAEIDGRKRLTAKDKRRISRAWNEHSEITQSKKTEFAVRKTSKKNVKLFKELGYKTYKNNVYINTEGAQYIHIGAEKVGGKKRVVIRKSGKHKDRIDFVIPYSEFHEVAEALEKRMLRTGEYITGQFEGRSQFHKKWTSMADFKKYLMDFQPQQPLNKSKRRSDKEQAKLKRKLFSKLSIVLFKQ